MREDILRGLKNAIERGESLERAAQSFVNAGYNPIEVRQAAQSLSEGVSSITEPYAKKIELPVLPKRPENLQGIQQPNIKQVYSMPRPQTRSLSTFQNTNEINSYKSKNKGLISILITVLLLLLCGLVLMFIYGQRLLDYVFGAA